LSIVNGDYIPICIDATQKSGDELPDWIKLDRVSGQLSITSESAMSQDIQLQVEIKHWEGTVKTFPCTITVEERKPLIEALKPAIKEMNAATQLHARVRLLLEEHLGKIYDFKQQAMRPCSLGEFLQVLSVCQSMLRATTAAHLLPRQTKPNAEARQPRVNPMTAQPMTPP